MRSGIRGHHTAEDAAGPAGSAFSLPSAGADSSHPQWLISELPGSHIRKPNSTMFKLKAFLPLASALDQRDEKDDFLMATVFLPIVYQVLIIKEKSKERRINHAS